MRLFDRNPSNIGKSQNETFEFYVDRIKLNNDQVNINELTLIADKHN